MYCHAEYVSSESFKSLEQWEVSEFSIARFDPIICLYTDKPNKPCKNQMKTELTNKLSSLLPHFSQFPHACSFFSLIIMTGNNSRNNNV